MKTRDHLETLLPHCTIRYGWILAGAGAARHGWGATTAAGLTTYLGGAVGALDLASKLGPAWGGP